MSAFMFLQEFQAMLFAPNSGQYLTRGDSIVEMKAYRLSIEHYYPSGSGEKSVK